ncbi:MAG: leucine-rich repeat protein [Clostridia bacterium]
MKRLMGVVLALLVALGGGAAASENPYEARKLTSYKAYGQAIAATQVKGLDGEDRLASRLLMRAKKAIGSLDEFEPVAVIAGPDHHYTVQFASAEKAVACMEEMRKDENILYVHQDAQFFIADAVQAGDAVPGDAFASPLGASEKTIYPHHSWGVEAMGTDVLAASITRAGSITVAVVDTGVGMHPYLNGRVKNDGADFIVPTNKHGRGDGDGHGTHVAGTIVDLTQGLKVNILPVRVLGDDGSGEMSGIANGIRYAADAGAKVVNLSLSGRILSPEMRSEINDAIDYAIQKDVTVVVAAGNDNADTAYATPANIKQAIVVAAIEPNEGRASFSNFGTSVDVAAPGTGIESCVPGGGYAFMRGTSMACPHIAAIAAMIKLQHPDDSPAKVEKALKASCRDLGKAGWDKYYGYGVPDFTDKSAIQSGDYTYKKTVDGATITGYAGAQAEISVPEALDGIKVIRIGESAFLGNEPLKKVTVPGSIDTIGARAFEACANLETVVLGEGVKKLEANLFYACPLLQNVTLPQSLHTIGSSAFGGCRALKHLALPANLQNMGMSALANTGLTRIVLPGSLDILSFQLLANCADLTSITIGEGSARIERFFARDCAKLTTVNLPQSVNKIEQGAFKNCVGLEAIDLMGVEDMDKEAFAGCENLARVAMPKMRRIGPKAFCGDPALQNIALPEGLTAIGDAAFQASGLTSITLPESLASLGEEAFADCARLASVEILQGLGKLNRRAFADCAALAFITLPRSIVDINPTVLRGSPNVTVSCYAGSAAAKFADRMGLAYRIIGAQIPLTKLNALEEMISLAVGQRVLLNVQGGLYTYAPSDATMPALHWVSSDPSVAAVVSPGVETEIAQALEAKRMGEATITGTAQDESGLSISIRLLVEPVKVDLIALDKVALTLCEGESATISAQIQPEDAAEKKVHWTSTNEEVATVDAGGVVKAHKTGKAMIVCTASDASPVSASCDVVVTKAQASAGDFAVKALDEQSIMITKYTGGATDVTIPSTIDGRKVTTIGEKAFFESNIARVTIPEGVTAIERKAFAGCKKLQSTHFPDSLIQLARDAFKGCKKLPKVKALSFKLNKEEDGYFMTPIFSPANTASTYAIKVAPKGAARTSDYGFIQPDADKKVTVTLTSGGKKAVLVFENGEPGAAESLKIKGKKHRTVKMGKTLALEYVLAPASAETILTWTSSDERIATVSSSGVVTPVKPGKAKITLAGESGLKAVVTLTVKAGKTAS